MATVAGSRVSRRPDIQGGDACIDGTRIPIWVLVNYRRLGGSDADLLGAYPSLTSTDLAAAWEYAADHRQEIDDTIRENEQGDEGPVE
jgi:uncharacterized protein (DUF433 family)